jgi:hypothetical protein
MEASYKPIADFLLGMADGIPPFLKGGWDGLMKFNP